MRVNWNEQEEGGGATFIEKQRYPLVVKEVKEGASTEKLTPFMKIMLVTEEGEPAWDKTLWMTAKALYRATEWFKAMGLPTEGDQNYDLARLAGIRLTAECSFRKYTDNGQEKKAVEWVNPQKVTIGSPAPTGGMGEMAPPKEARSPINDQEVPF